MILGGCGIVWLMEGTDLQTVRQDMSNLIVSGRLQVARNHSLGEAEMVSPMHCAAILQTDY
jgi:hypothetical protein